MPGPTPARAIAAMLDQPSRFKPHGARPDGGTPVIVARGSADGSVLALRMRSRNPVTQMPPLGTQLIDPAGVRWLSQTWLRVDRGGSEVEIPFA